MALDIQSILEDAGLSVDGPYAGIAEASEAIDRQLPHIAILDVSLRDGEIFPIADRLRELGIPIIFHSGHADGTDLRTLYPDAAICPKPCSPSVLAVKIA